MRRVLAKSLVAVPSLRGGGDEYVLMSECIQGVATEGAAGEAWCVLGLFTLC